MSAAVLAFLVRMLATAGIVLAVTSLVGRLGPRIGGVVAGLPIVVGPGLAFLALDHPPAFLAEAAAFALLSLVATQGFMLAYGVCARRAAPPAALAAAVALWALAAVALFEVALGPFGGMALFVAAAVLSRAVLLRGPAMPAAMPTGDGLLGLLARAGLAGILVGAITVAASDLGPRAAGLVLAYPVGMTVIAVSVHRRHGRAAVIGTLAAAAFGTASIAVFALVVAVLAPVLGAAVSLGAALAASLLLTLVLLVLAGRTVAPSPRRS